GGQANAAVPRRLEDRVYRRRMHAGEDHRRGSAVAQQLIEKEPGNFAGVLWIAEALFGGEGVAFEPLEQLLPVGGDDVRLWIVDVGVEKAGSDECAAVIDDRRFRRKVVFDRRPGVDPFDATVANNQRPVFQVDVRTLSSASRIVDEVQDLPAKCGGGVAAVLLCARSVRS